MQLDFNGNLLSEKKIETTYPPHPVGILGNNIIIIHSCGYFKDKLNYSELQECYSILDIKSDTVKLLMKGSIIKMKIRKGINQMGMKKKGDTDRR